MIFKKFLLGTTLATIAATAAIAGKADNSVTMALFREYETADVYFNTAREGVMFRDSIFDGLLYRDVATGEYHGNLAKEWSWVDDVTMEFKLREGVTFHNGEVFNADDVVYTFNFALDPAKGTKNQAGVAWMKSVEKIDDYTVRVHLKAPFPAAVDFLAGLLVIYPNEHYEKVGQSGMSETPVGTGPFKVLSNNNGSHMVLGKFDDYFEGPKAKAKVDKVEIRSIPDVNTQIAEFMNGRLDFLWNIPSDLTERLAGTNRYNVQNGQAMRIGFLQADAAGRSDPNGPMTKREVRQAMYHAIDREKIVAELLKGSSVVINSACTPAQTACTTDLPSYDYDPAKAKELLAQAGYPDGFTIDFYAYRDRPYAEAVMGYLNAVGIKTNLQYVQYAIQRDKIRGGEVALSFGTWGSNGVADASASTGEFFTGGPEDTARDPEITEWIKSADTMVDAAARADLYKKALTKIVDEAYWVPLFLYNVNYVMNNDFDFTPPTDELIRFYDFAWK